MNAKWKGGGTRWNSSAGLEELGRRRCRYVVGSASEDFRAGKRVRGMGGECDLPIFKEKGDIQDCGNYRGIKMISHPMKICERITDRRLREETSIGEEQFVFMPSRGTTECHI